MSSKIYLCNKKSGSAGRSPEKNQKHFLAICRQIESICRQITKKRFIFMPELSESRARNGCLLRYLVLRKKILWLPNDQIEVFSMSDSAQNLSRSTEVGVQSVEPLYTAVWINVEVNHAWASEYKIFDQRIQILFKNFSNFVPKKICEKQGGGSGMQ